MGSNASPVLQKILDAHFFGGQICICAIQMFFCIYVREISSNLHSTQRPRSTTNGGGPVEPSGVGGSRSQQISTTTNNGKPGDQSEQLSQYEKLSQYERLATEKKKPEVKEKPKLPKVIPVVKSVSKNKYTNTITNTTRNTNTV